MLARPMWPGSGRAERVDVAEAAAVVVHLEHDERRPRSAGARVTCRRMRVLAGVRHRLLGDAEERARRPRAAARRPSISVLTAKPYRRSQTSTQSAIAWSNDSSSNACGPSSTISSRRKAMFAAGERARLAQRVAAPVACSPVVERLLGGGQHQLDARRAPGSARRGSPRPAAAGRSDSVSIVRRESARARSRPLDSAVRSAPTTSAVGQAGGRRRRPRRRAAGPSSTGTSVARLTGIRTAAGSARPARLRSRALEVRVRGDQEERREVGRRVRLRLDA